MKKLMALFIISIMATSVYAQKPAIMTSSKPGWHKIGEVTADFKKEKDEIIVLGADRFKSILLKVTDAPVSISDVTVYFENGSTQDIQVRKDIGAGEETRVIDLKGGSPALKKVSFIYKTLPNRKDDKAHVELYGLK